MKGNDINAMFVSTYDWSTLSLCDILFMQRPYTDQHVIIAEVAKNCGKPVWIDYDDDLFAVPEDNPTYGLYSRDKVQEDIIKLVSMADVITCSTEGVASRMRQIEAVAQRKFDIRVIPNSLDLDLINRIKRPEQKQRHKLVFWRGSNTHQKDLLTCGYEIIQAAQAHQDFTFQFLGINPWYITQKMNKNQAIVSEGLDVMVYHEFLQSLQPPIMIVPLHDSEFNRAKSNIAWLEGTSAGAMVLAPNTSEWQHEGVINYSNPEDFGVKLRDMMSGKYDLKSVVEASRKTICEKFSLSKNNQKRVDLIYELANKNQGTCQNPWAD